MRAVDLPQRTVLGHPRQGAPKDQRARRKKIQTGCDEVLGHHFESPIEQTFHAEMLVDDRHQRVHHSPECGGERGILGGQVTVEGRD